MTFTKPGSHVGATVAKWTIKSLGRHLSLPQVSYWRFARRTGIRRTVTALQTLSGKKKFNIAFASRRLFCCI
jgi:hypothetical protein